MLSSGSPEGIACLRRSRARLLIQRAWKGRSRTTKRFRLHRGAGLPSIRDFIAKECPVPGLDGQYREQPRDATLEAAVIECSLDELPCPGQRRLLRVPEQLLDMVITDKGQVILACLDKKPETLRVLQPPKGSYACLAQVLGLQRLASTQQALVRVEVQDRVVIQALSGNGSEGVLRAQAAALRDRWAYFVRLAALEAATAGGISCSSTDEPSPPAVAAAAGAGRDVSNALAQLEDVCLEVEELLAVVAAAVQGVYEGSTTSPTSAAGAGGLTGAAGAGPTAGLQALQEELIRFEVAEELEHLQQWVGSSTGRGSEGGSPGNLMERAWRLSYAPLAAGGLSQALGAPVGGEGGESEATKTRKAATARAGSSSSLVGQAMTASDLGMRLELAFEHAQRLRSLLSARLALANQLAG